MMLEMASLSKLSSVSGFDNMPAFQTCSIQKTLAMGALYVSVVRYLK